LKFRLPSWRRQGDPPPAAPPPAVPGGMRVYAIGDVHGCADELRLLLDLIRSDHHARPPATQTIILLGDLINRGPDSARVIACARDLVQSGIGRVLKGNHEEVFVSAARGDRHAARIVMKLGGMATLRSFGLTEQEVEQGNFQDLAALLKVRIPRDVVSFLDSGADKLAIGDYLFVHAGVRPGVPIEEQRETDLRWIREEFLASSASFGPVIVHGHSISEDVDERPNRIGIDTGAFRTGKLTAIGLEGTDRWYISTAT
jgi:serine/threonine protein phosphatase 1